MAPPKSLTAGRRPLTSEEELELSKLPVREIVTPMGKAKFKNKELEEKGYRYSFSRNCDERLIEIVYLRKDGSTGTLIADVNTLFAVSLKDEDTYTITLKVFKTIVDDSALELHRVDVPALMYDNYGLAGILLRAVLDHVLQRAFGREKVLV